MIKPSTLLLLIPLLFPTVALAENAKTAKTDYHRLQQVLDTDRTVMGEILPPSGKPARVLSVIVTIAPGESTGWHKHGVPLYAHMLSGRITVDYGKGGKRDYGPGEAFLEAMDHWHNGHNTGTEPARILAVFFGHEGGQNVIRKK